MEQNAIIEPHHLIINTYVLDDDVDEIEILNHYLESVCGTHLHLYTNPEQFIAAVEDGVHLGIIDHQLNASIDGIEVGKRVLDKNRFAKLILFSGSPNPEVWRRAMNAGFIGGFDKNSPGAYKELADFVSYQLVELREKIEQWTETYDSLMKLNSKYEKFL